MQTVQGSAGGVLLGEVIHFDSNSGRLTVTTESGDFSTCWSDGRGRTTRGNRVGFMGRMDSSRPSDLCPPRVGDRVVIGQLGTDMTAGVWGYMEAPRR